MQRTHKEKQVTDAKIQKACTALGNAVTSINALLECGDLNEWFELEDRGKLIRAKQAATKALMVF